VFEIALRGGAAAGRGGAGGVPDLGQVPEHDARIVAAGLMAVVALAGGDRLDPDQQVRLAGQPGGQPPGAIPAGRSRLVIASEREPWAPAVCWLPGRGPVPVPGSAGTGGPIGVAGPTGRVMHARGGRFAPLRRVVALVFGFGPGAAVADGVPVLVGDGDAPGGAGGAGGGGQVAGQRRVSRSRSKYTQRDEQDTPE
jgi:hypothetical protein